MKFGFEHRQTANIARRNTQLRLELASLCAEEDSVTREHVFVQRRLYWRQRDPVSGYLVLHEISHRNASLVVDSAQDPIHDHIGRSIGADEVGDRIAAPLFARKTIQLWSYIIWEGD